MHSLPDVFPVTTIYLDFPATTPLDSRVFERMRPWLGPPANPHAVQHAYGRAAANAVEDAARQVSEATGAPLGGVIFTPGASFANNQIIRSFARPGEAIVTTVLEHPSVISPVRESAAVGATVIECPTDSNGIVDSEYVMERAENASLVSVMAVNNEIGTIQAVHDIARYCAALDIPFHCDASQALGRIDLGELASNALVTLSSHKIYGPSGIGAICGPDRLTEQLKPLVTGGGQQRSLVAGTIPTALCVGFAQACELAAAETKADWDHATRMSACFRDNLKACSASFVPNVDLALAVPHILSLRFPGVDAEALLGAVPEIAAATGSACRSGALAGSPVLRGLGFSQPDVGATIRFGFGRTSTADEATCAAELVATALARIAR